MDQKTLEIIREWHAELGEHPGARAQLRRARTLGEVALTPPYYDLLNRLRRGRGDRRLSMVAGLLAHVKERKASGKARREGIAAQMAALKGGKPIVSELRFRRLLSLQRAELFRPLIRVIRLLDRHVEVDIDDLAESIHYWGDKQKLRWAEQYYLRLAATE